MNGKMTQIKIDPASFGGLEVYIPVNSQHLPTSGSILVEVMVKTTFFGSLLNNHEMVNHQQETKIHHK